LKREDGGLSGWASKEVNEEDDTNEGDDEAEV
jgi:hypothetical protein